MPDDSSPKILTPFSDPDNSLYVEPYPVASATYGKGVVPFIEVYRECLLNQPPFHPFRDQEEWEFAEKLMTSGMSLTQVDQLIKLPIVSYISILYLYLHKHI